MLEAARDVLGEIGPITAHALGIGNRHRHFAELVLPFEVAQLEARMRYGKVAIAHEGRAQRHVELLLRVLHDLLDGVARLAQPRLHRIGAVHQDAEVDRRLCAHRVGGGLGRDDRAPGRVVAHGGGGLGDLGRLLLHLVDLHQRLRTRCERAL
eukprot:2597009-Prymnesium_polylepis.1